MLAVALIDNTIGLGDDSNWIFPFYAALVAGEVLGGWTAARRRPDAPALHGAAAALAAYAVLAAVGSAVRLSAGNGLDPVALAFNGLIATAAGILGGLLADLRGARTASPS
jgi:hypothetical protein